jgi:hypothetical protein
VITPGKILLHLYHQPVGRLRDCLREGGPWAQRKTARGRREMERAAANLPPLPERPGDPLAVHLLTGRRFWPLTAFCLHSLARASAAPIAAQLYDDGTLDEPAKARLRALGGRITVHESDAIRERLERCLPERRFPALRERWRNYPNLRKLTDPHLGSQGWKLALDSDLLFFRPPDALLRWGRAPAAPLHAVDCEESYGYSRALMERLAGAPIPPLVNVGLCGLRSDALDWERLEAWTAELIARERTNYYLEQALVAMLMAREPERVVLPAGDYVTFPGRGEVERPRAVMHHYVAHSKRWYFQIGWRHLAA